MCLETLVLSGCIALPGTSLSCLVYGGTSDLEGFGLSLAICILQNWRPNLTAQQMVFNRSTHLQLKCINGIANFTIAMLLTLILSVGEGLPTMTLLLFLPC